MRNRVRGWLRQLNARQLLIAGGMLAATFVVYFWNLAKLTPGLSPAESAARAGSKSLHVILNNPVNAPQRLLQCIAQKLGYHGAFSMRLASVIMALVFVGCMFWLMKSWFALSIGVIATLIFATMPMVILLARSATGNVMLLSPTILLASYVWLARHRHKPKSAWLLFMWVSALSLYIPGMAWLVFAGFIVMRKKIVLYCRPVGKMALLTSCVGFMIIVLPLIIALTKNLTIYHDLLLIPAHWHGLAWNFKSIGWAALSLVWRTREHNPLIIGRLPLLSIIQLALIVFGSYAMWTRARHEMIAVLALVVAAIALAGINNNLLLLSLCLPALATLCGAGLRYLYIEWRSIFPLNPIPLGFALVVIVSLVSLQVAYGLRYSLVAWPATTATKQLYVLK